MIMADFKAVLHRRQLQIWEQLQHHSQTEVAELFGITQTSVSKMAARYAKKYGLPMPDKRKTLHKSGGTV